MFLQLVNNIKQHSRRKVLKWAIMLSISNLIFTILSYFFPHQPCPYPHPPPHHHHHPHPHYHHDHHHHFHHYDFHCHHQDPPHHHQYRLQYTLCMIFNFCNDVMQIKNLQQIGGSCI